MPARKMPSSGSGAPENAQPKPINAGEQSAGADAAPHKPRRRRRKPAGNGGVPQNMPSGE